MDPFEAIYRVAQKELQGETPLFLAVSYGNNALFKRLLEKSEQRAKFKDTDIGHDCLNCAIIQDNKEIVKALVELPLSEFDWIRKLFSRCILSA
jgi:ankyrin repeat protein